MSMQRNENSVDNCAYDLKRTVCSLTGPRICYPIYIFQGGVESLRFTLVTSSNLIGHYDIHVYKLCDGETAGRVTMMDVLRKGRNCPRPDTTSRIRLEFTGCDDNLTTGMTDYTLYSFSDQNTSCPFSHRFVFINTTGMSSNFLK